MLNRQFEMEEQLYEILDEHLVPYVQKVDQEAYYAGFYLKELGKNGLFSMAGKTKEGIILERMALIKETAKVCMTTAFCVWCHLAAITYLTNTDNKHLSQEILPKLIAGDIIAGTGLSNPLKSFTHLEKIHLQAKKVDGGYSINGALPAISNIGPDHSFAFIASKNDAESIMFLTACDVDGLTMKKHTNFVGLNGSATYGCQLQDVFVPDNNIIALDAFDYVQQVRSEFVTYQIPLGLGVISASIEAMEATLTDNGGLNQSLRNQPHVLRQKYDALYQGLTQLIKDNDFAWEKILSIRLEVAYLTLEVVQAGMIHSGGSGYVKTSHVARRLREAYFIVNLTPTIKHLEKILIGSAQS